MTTDERYNAIKVMIIHNNIGEEDFQNANF